MEERALEAHSRDGCCTSMSEQVAESFNCSICLELVYKPIVQACGHLFCFWCVFQAMNYLKESHCPVCRRPYMYFPRVCELLHFMLAKAVPEEYQKRGREIQCAEEEKQVFSPRFLESPRQQWSPRKHEVAGLNPQIMLSGTPRNAACINGVAASNFATEAGKKDCHGSINSGSVAENDCQDMGELVPIAQDGSIECTKSTLTVDDFFCSACNDLVYRPVVLNCGEVVCESCLQKPNPMVLNCPSCSAPHPAGSVLVCLTLHHYLESAFPTDYEKRKQDSTHQQPKENNLPVVCDTAKDCDANVRERELEESLHIGVGCDGCGMYPIVGDRYRCEECTEIIGFDLCASCYENGGSLLGRFNQEHKPIHRMKQVKSRARCFLVFDMRNSTIQRRRQQQPTSGDLDEYIESFID